MTADHGGGDIETLTTGTLDEAADRFDSQRDKEQLISSSLVRILSDSVFEVNPKSGHGRYTVSLVRYMDTLHLNLNAEYYEQIDDGRKSFEYRLRTEYWRKRLEGRQYRRILIKKGYPKANDNKRVMERPWRGYEEQTITHPHFGPEPVEVFAIRVN